MRQLAALLLALSVLLAVSLSASLDRHSDPQPSAQLRFRIADAPSARGVPRLGINLGGRTSWGAEQLMANLLPNPGFEPTIDGAIVIVRAVYGSEFTDDSAWLARSTGFWNGAAFSVRTGHCAGVEGRIVDSGAWQGYPHFRADRSLARLAPGDVIALTRNSAAGLPAQWWWQNPERIHVSPSHPPGSPGTQSLVMSPEEREAVAAISYLDMIGDRAGKLLVLRGEWTVRFWARATGGGQLTVQLRRLNANPFLRESIRPGPGWREFRFCFTPQDDASPSGLEFRLETEGAGAQIFIDDVSLAPSDSGAHAFRPEVIAALRLLHPGYLRDWQGQLSDTFANRLASVEARRPIRYRPGDETSFAYSLPEFLELCHSVDAQPWVVLPTTLGDEEWKAAGAWLENAIQRFNFREVVVEFGNENWNATFRPAGIQDPDRMSEAAERGFSRLRAAAGQDPRILPAIGGQFVNPDGLADSLHMVPDARLVALAPYYARAIPPVPDLEDTIGELFSVDTQHLQAYSKLARQSGRSPAIYEMNASSLDGNATPDSVSQLVTSAAAGSALLYHSLAAMRAGIDRQCFYALAGFDTFRSDGKLVRLFGLARDLAAPDRLRPTGLAMQIANRAIGGDAYDVVAIPSSPEQNPTVMLRAFRSDGRWAILAASASSRHLDITVELPPGVDHSPDSLLALRRGSPLSGNEEVSEVSLVSTPLASSGNQVRFHLEPYGIAAAYSEPSVVPIRNKPGKVGTPSISARRSLSGLY
jgi:hypothetical protein